MSFVRGALLYWLCFPGVVDMLLVIGVCFIFIYLHDLFVSEAFLRVLLWAWPKV